MKKEKINFIICIFLAAVLVAPSFTALEYNIKNASTSSPILKYKPTTRDLGYIEEGNIYYTTFEIWNAGNETLTWSLNWTQPWINVLNDNGTSTGEHDIVQVSINTAGLSPGPYTGFITINSNDMTSIHCFTVNFTINQPPNTPSRPNGPSSGEIGEKLLFSTSTTDPEGDNIRYGLDVNSDGVVDHWSDTYHVSGVTYYVFVTFFGSGTYYLRFKARDIHGAESGFSLAKKVVINGENDPPETPSVPSGPSTGSIDVSYSFTTRSVDPDEDDIKYGWDWNGDDVIDEWTGFYESGDSITRSHVFSSPGTYHIKVVAEDEHGAQSSFSASETIVISGNNPPNKPLTPSGLTSCRVGISYSYSTATVDPEGDNVFYLFDWGDGTTSGWVGPFSSGSGVTDSHVWSTTGSFPIKVMAKDDPNGDGDPSDGSVSVWSDPLPISMPKNKQKFWFDFQFMEWYQTILEFIGSLINW